MIKKNMNRNLKYVFLITALFFGLSGCIRDLEESLDKINRVSNVKWSPEFAVPLVSSKLTLGDILKQTPNAFIRIDSDNLIHIVYRDEVVSLLAKDFAKFNAQKFSGNINLSPMQMSELTTNGSTRINFSTIFNFGIQDMEIDSVIMKACALATKITSTLQHDVEIKLSLPGIRKDGTSFSATFNIPYNPGNNTLSRNISLSGWHFDLTQSGDKQFSQLLANFEITVTEVSGNGVSASDEIAFNADFLYNEYEVMFGYVGEKQIASSIPDTMVFNIFTASNTSGATTGTFSISDPRIKVIMTNSYGVPISAEIVEFSTLSTRNGKTQLTGYPDPLVVPVPSRSQIGQTLRDSFTLNKGNSNISSILSNIPDKLIYQTGILINPPGTTERNFILPTSNVTFTVDVDIPLHGTADGFVLEQTQPIDLDFEDIEELESATIRLYTENEFPMDVGLQIYFVDNSNLVLDSLIQPYQLFLQSPVVGASGRIEQKTSKTMDFVINRARLDKIQNTDHVLIKGTLNTFKPGGPQPDVKFFSDYGIYVKLGVQAKATINQKVR